MSDVVGINTGSVEARVDVRVGVRADVGVGVRVDVGVRVRADVGVGARVDVRVTWQTKWRRPYYQKFSRNLCFVEWKHNHLCIPFDGKDI